MNDYAHVARSCGLAGHDHHHVAFFRELNGIGNQIADALAHTHRIEFHPGRDARIDEELETDALLLCRRLRSWHA